MAGIFKAYDIRGIYGDTLNEDLAEKFGRAFVTFLGCRKVVVGRDMRPHSDPLFQALARGLTGQGADVIDVGVVSTPMTYYANGSLGADASIMITASHNPGEWNGFKLCREQAIPISGATGIADLERIVQEEAFAPPAATPGSVTTHDIRSAYRDHIAGLVSVDRELTLAVDYANAMGIVEAEVFRAVPNLKLDPLFDTLDGTFPNHEANPLLEETYEALQHKIRSGTYDFGIAFDGDADRVGFTDETGRIIAMDLITALIAESLLETHPGAAIFYDLRSSWAVKEVIEANGGRPFQSRVGHAFIKAQMREQDAVFAGELSGHYYFKDNYTTESSALAVLHVAALVAHTGQKLSELVAPLRKYSASGEINSTVADAGAVLKRLEESYQDGRVYKLDGLSVEYPDWWFNVRASNTEPLIRLNLEARDEATMAARRDEVLALIRG